MNLKETYESFLSKDGGGPTAEKRNDIIQHIQRELKPLETFDDWMRSEPTRVGIRVRALLDRTLAFQEIPELTVLEKERLPDYADWVEHEDVLEKYQSQIGHFIESKTISKHPLGLLSFKLSYVERPAEFVDTKLATVLRAFDQFHNALQKSGVDESHWSNLEAADDLMAYVDRMQPILSADQISLLDSKSDTSLEFMRRISAFREQKALCEAAAQDSANWREKIPQRDLVAAIEQATALESTFLAWLRPAWWRLRSVLNKRYDFSSHVVRPKWSDVLEQLQSEYSENDKLERMRGELASRYNISENAEAFVDAVHDLRERADDWPEHIRQLHDGTIQTKDSSGLKTLIDSLYTWQEFSDEYDKLCEARPDVSLAELRARLAAIQENLDLIPEFLSMVEPLKSLPERLRTAIQSAAYPPALVEAAIAAKTLEAEYLRERGPARFGEAQRQHHVASLQVALSELAGSKCRGSPSSRALQVPRECPTGRCLCVVPRR